MVNGHQPETRYRPQHVLDWGGSTPARNVSLMSKRFSPLVLILMLAANVHVFAQTTDDLFNGNILHEIRIVVHPRDWATLKQDYLGNNVYAADFHWLYNGRDVYEPGVSVRSRGQGSR